MLSDDMLDEEPARLAPSEPGERRPQNAEEELTLDEQDFVRPGSVAAESSRSVVGEEEGIAPPVTTAPPRPVSRTVEVPAELPAGADVRRITVPIDLGQIPPSGRVTLTFEVRIHVEPATGGAHETHVGGTVDCAVESGIDESFTQDLEVLR